MQRKDIFEELNKIKDPVSDYGKILSNLHYTHFYLMDRYKKILSVYDLTPAQSNVLGILMYFYPESVSLEQVKEMVLEPNSDVSRIISRLCEKGYAEKRPDAANRRKLSIRITAAGEQTLKEITSDPNMYVFTAKISMEEAIVLIQVLEKLRNAHI